jgi:hypothetical protein
VVARDGTYRLASLDDARDAPSPRADHRRRPKRIPLPARQITVVAPDATFRRPVIDTAYDADNLIVDTDRRMAVLALRTF